MKRFLFIILVSVLTTIQIAQSSSIKGDYDSEIAGVEAGGGDGVPWPFNLEQPFPWSNIQGLWEADVDGWQRYFVFRVVGKPSGNDRKLQIFEYDGVTCDLISKGTGFEKSKVLTAGMLNEEGRYLLQVRAFKESDVKKIRRKPQTAFTSTARLMFALSIAPWGAYEARRTYLLSKVSLNPVFVCE